MKFHPSPISGVYQIELFRIEDERGFFARSFCEQEFSEHGLVTHFPQCNVSFNVHVGTLRGLHYSVPPSAEAKLVRCIRGSVYDVYVDLRPDSPTYLKWESLILSEENRYLLYLPEGVAHGFQTLEENTELFYHMSVPYQPSCERGVRWDDPVLQITWPFPHPIVSKKDQQYPNIS